MPALFDGSFDRPELLSPDTLGEGGRVWGHICYISVSVVLPLGRLCMLGTIVTGASCHKVHVRNLIFHVLHIPNTY